MLMCVISRYTIYVFIYYLFTNNKTKFHNILNAEIVDLLFAESAKNVPTKQFFIIIRYVNNF